jgi:metal-responsive CopG/Arc/MetJ family transcriptional regulator
LRTYKVLSLSLPPKLFKEVDRRAKKENRTRSEFLREAIRRYIEEREWAELQIYGAKQANKLSISKEDVETLVDEERD